MLSMGQIDDYGTNNHQLTTQHLKYILLKLNITIFQR